MFLSFDESLSVNEATMDKESLLTLGLTVCAIGVSAFIFWGPKLGPKAPKFRAGHVRGLQNLGLTCFLNALLQALASCPYFLEWLSTHKGNGRVTDALLSLLKTLSSDGDSSPVSPGDLISSLTEHGWTIAPREQDSHELLLLLVTTLEEEEHKSAKVGLGVLSESLADLSQVGNDRDASGDYQPPSITKIDISSPTRSLCDVKMLPPPFRGYLASQIQCLSCNFKSPMRYDKFDTLSLALPSTLGPRESVKLQALIEAFVRAEVVDGFACDACTRDTKNDSGPRATSKAIRTVRIGKLPKCLCLHISRTYMTPLGLPYKKDNYVDFPEFLQMGKYTQNSYLREAKLNSLRRKKLEELASSLDNRSLPTVNEGGGENPSVGMENQSESHDGNLPDGLISPPSGLVSPPSGFVSPPSGLVSPPSELVSPHSGIVSPMVSVTPERAGSPELHSDTATYITPNATPSVNETPPRISRSNPLGQQLYRIKAVVEHRGTVENGHFVTYRKGPIETNIRHRSGEPRPDRWFFTSDADVRDSSLCHAMMSNAYMLFYEKCSAFEER